LQEEGAGFGHDTNKVSLFFRDGRKKSTELKSKPAIAKDIIDSITEILK
jgi:phosphopantothenoylcysteine decarboxylase/phosphopantothenate--cysteine ligase